MVFLAHFLYLPHYESVFGYSDGVNTMSVTGITATYSNPYFTLRSSPNNTNNVIATTNKTPTAQNDYVYNAAPFKVTNVFNDPVLFNVDVVPARNRFAHETTQQSSLSPFGLPSEYQVDLSPLPFNYSIAYNSYYDQRIKNSLPAVNYKLDKNGEQILDANGRPMVELTADHLRYPETTYTSKNLQTPRYVVPQNLDYGGWCPDIPFAPENNRQEAFFLSVYSGGDGNYYTEEGLFFCRKDELEKPTWTNAPKTETWINGLGRVSYDDEGYLRYQDNNELVRQEDLDEINAQAHASAVAAEKVYWETPPIADEVGAKIAKAWLAENYENVDHRELRVAQERLINRILKNSPSSAQEKLREELATWQIGRAFDLPLIQKINEVMDNRNNAQAVSSAMEIIRTYQRAVSCGVEGQFVYEINQVEAQNVDKVVAGFALRLDLAQQEHLDNLAQFRQEIAQKVATIQPAPYQADDPRLQIFSLLGVNENADDYFVNNFRWLDLDSADDNLFMEAVKKFIIQFGERRNAEFRLSDLMRSYSGAISAGKNAEYADYLAKVMDENYVAELRNAPSLSEREEMIVANYDYFALEKSKNSLYEIIDGQIHYSPSIYRDWIDAPWKKSGFVA